jgi:hypothetical protein
LLSKLKAGDMLEVGTPEVYFAADADHKITPPLYLEAESLPFYLF